MRITRQLTHLTYAQNQDVLELDKGAIAKLQAEKSKWFELVQSKIKCHPHQANRHLLLLQIKVVRHGYQRYHFNHWVIA